MRLQYRNSLVFLLVTLISISSCSVKQLVLPETKNTEKIVLYKRINIMGNRAPWTGTNVHVRKGDQLLMLVYGDVQVKRGKDVRREDLLWSRVSRNTPIRVLKAGEDTISYYTAQSTGEIKFSIADGIGYSRYWENFEEWKKGSYNRQAYQDNYGKMTVDLFVIYKSNEQYLSSALEDMQMVNSQDRHFVNAVHGFKKEYGWMADLFSETTESKQTTDKSEEEIIWEQYQEKDNAEGYVEFISQYPDSPYIGTAKNRIHYLLINKYKDGFWSANKHGDNEAIALFEEMAGHGIGLANAILADIHYLGLNGEPNHAEAAYQAELAMEKKDPFGTCLYIKYLYRGIGMSMDEARAKDIAYTILPKVLAQAYTNDPLSQYSLGWLYFNGIGVPRNQKEAFSLYQKAAIEGYPAAQYNVGIAYLNGEGVEQDYNLAKKWIEKYAELDFGKAQNDLGWMYEHGLGQEKNIEQAIRWYKSAAAKGVCLAQLNLGIIFEQGREGIAKDLEAAKRWYQMAANQGDNDAIKALMDLK